MRDIARRAVLTAAPAARGGLDLPAQPATVRRRSCGVRGRSCGSRRPSVAGSTTACAGEADRRSLVRRRSFCPFPASVWTVCAGGAPCACVAAWSARAVRAGNDFYASRCITSTSRADRSAGVALAPGPLRGGDAPAPCLSAVQAPSYVPHGPGGGPARCGPAPAPARSLQAGASARAAQTDGRPALARPGGRSRAAGRRRGRLARPLPLSQPHLWIRWDWGTAGALRVAGRA